MISVAVICWLLLIHFIADFICQTEWMANNKSLALPPLILHVLVYGIVLMGAFTPVIGFVSATLFGTVNLVLHFCTDYVTSRVMRRLKEKENIRGFFQVLGIDQLIHGWCLVYTLWLFT